MDLNLNEAINPNSPQDSIRGLALNPGASGNSSESLDLNLTLQHGDPSDSIGTSRQAVQYNPSIEGTWMSCKLPPSSDFHYQEWDFETSIWRIDHKRPIFLPYLERQSALLDFSMPMFVPVPTNLTNCALPNEVGTNVMVPVISLLNGVECCWGYTPICQIRPDSAYCILYNSSRVPNYVGLKFQTHSYDSKFALANMSVSPMPCMLNLGGCIGFTARGQGFDKFSLVHIAPLEVNYQYPHVFVPLHDTNHGSPSQQSDMTTLSQQIMLVRPKQPHPSTISNGPWQFVRCCVCHLKTAITRASSRSDMSTIRDALEVSAEM